MEFRLLKPEEIDVKVGTIGNGYYTLLLYKNARVDMAILDETVGAENWQRDHKEVKGNLYCGIGILVMKEIWEPYETTIDGVSRSDVYHSIKSYEPVWVWKWDCGVESQFGDKEKGEASDSFKRAGFNWGIGRELYTSPKIYVNCETAKIDDKHFKIKNAEDVRRSNSLRVKEIEYNDKREIVKLVIVDNKGVQVFPNSIVKVEESAKTEQIEDICCAECGSSVSKKVADYSVSKFGKVLCYNCQKNQKPKEVDI